jgi:hypothetical protein
MVTVSYSLPHTGFCPPSKDEAGKLMRIVDGGRPELGLVASVDLSEFRYALRASGFMFRTVEPVSKYAFAHFLDAGNALLSERWGAPGVSGVAFLGAIHAHADISWRRADASLGLLLEIGLNEFQGRQCENAWRGLLTGERNLMAPRPPPASLVREKEARNSVSFYRQAADGSMRPVGSNESLWDRS